MALFSSLSSFTMRWWLFFCLQALAYVLAGYFGAFKMILVADFTFISFGILFANILTTVWLGYLTREAEHGRPVEIETGWFISDQFQTWGMIGTIIGFIAMVNGTLGISNAADLAGLKTILTEVTKGMGTSLWTTLVGLVCSFAVKVQMNNLEKAAGK